MPSCALLAFFGFRVLADLELALVPFPSCFVQFPSSSLFFLLTSSHINQQKLHSL